jgi:putative RecB family exonuclease
MALNHNKRPVESVKDEGLKRPVKEGGKRFELETLPPDLTIPQGYMSSSQVSMYLRCPMQYCFRYIKKVKSPPAVALVEGTCHHEAIGMNNEHFVSVNKNLRTPVVIEKFADEFSTVAPTIPKQEWKMSGETKDSVIARGRLMLTNYMTNAAPIIRPVKKPERKAELVFGGVPFLMFIDCEEKKRVIDYKTTSSKKSSTDADLDLQLTIYAKATGKEEVAFCCLTKTKAADVVIVPSHRVKKDFDMGEDTVRGVVDAIRKGAFPMCDPTNTFPCSEKWCGYWKMCRGRYK